MHEDVYRCIIADLCAMPLPYRQTPAERARYMALRSQLWQWIVAGEDPYARWHLAADFEVECMQAAAAGPATTGPG
jgi:hypothetical protein